MSLEKDIRDLTAAVNNLASAMREQVTVTMPVQFTSGVPNENDRLADLATDEAEQWRNSPPGTPAPLSVREPYDVKAVTANAAQVEAVPLTFDAVKQVFLDIARGAPDPMEGSKRSRAVLAKYGASKLKDVEEAKWPAFVEDCRAAAVVVV